MKNEYIIITSLQSWDTLIGTSIRDIAMEFSKDNHVLFINSPLDIKTFLSDENIPETVIRKKVVKSKKELVRKINKNLWLLDFPFTVFPVQFLPDGSIFDFVNKLNNKKIYIYAKLIAQKLEFKDYYLFIDSDIYRSFYAKKYLDPKYTIFYYRDNLTQVKYWAKHAPRLIPKICKEANLVLTNSAYLADLIKANNSATYDVGQGVNTSLYDYTKEYQIPEDIKNIEKPIIGYTGFLTSMRLDIELMYKLAKLRPNYSFVLVGPEDDEFKNHKLHKLANVHFLGCKQYKEIPAYIASFDICYNPQLSNEVTNGNYPLKIDEYLSMGKPIIATKTDFMKLFGDTVWTCNNIESYIKAMDNAISDKSVEAITKRINMAKLHSWEENIKRISERIKSNPNFKKK